MKCKKCLCTDSSVVESRSEDEGRLVRRRRECSSCNFRFTTYEISSLEDSLKVNQDYYQINLESNSYEDVYLNNSIENSLEKLNSPDDLLMSPMYELVKDFEVFTSMFEKIKNKFNSPYFSKLHKRLYKRMQK